MPLWVNERMVAHPTGRFALQIDAVIRIRVVAFLALSALALTSLTRIADGTEISVALFVNGQRLVDTAIGGIATVLCTRILVVASLARASDALAFCAALVVRRAGVAIVTPGPGQGSVVARTIGQQGVLGTWVFVVTVHDVRFDILRRNVRLSLLGLAT